MNYVFDTSSFRVLFKNYYQSRFPKLWKKFNALIQSGSIISTREVGREIDSFNIDLLQTWKKEHKNIFTVPTASEAEFIAEIYKVAHFQQNIENKKILKGGFNADAFVIAKARVVNATVVTEESHTPKGVRIPNICQHFSIPCFNLEKFMEGEGWQF